MGLGYRWVIAASPSVTVCSADERWMCGRQRSVEKTFNVVVERRYCSDPLEWM
jgi:hypothetical protein